ASRRAWRLPRGTGAADRDRSPADRVRPGRSGCRWQGPRGGAGGGGQLVLRRDPRHEPRPGVPQLWLHPLVPGRQARRRQEGPRGGGERMTTWLVAPPTDDRGERRRRVVTAALRAAYAMSARPTHPEGMREIARMTGVVMEAHGPGSGPVTPMALVDALRRPLGDLPIFANAEDGDGADV